MKETSRVGVGSGPVGVGHAVWHVHGDGLGVGRLAPLGWRVGWLGWAVGCGLSVGMGCNGVGWLQWAVGCGTFGGGPSGRWEQRAI